VPKVSDLNETVAAQEHVAGLDVAVDGVLRLVQIPQALQHLRRHALQRGLWKLHLGEGGAVDDLSKGKPVHIKERQPQRVPAKLFTSAR
jgi:hypothetical protein